MKLSELVWIISFLLVPTFASAWGPLTHIYLGNELFSLGALIPAGILELMRRYRKDFLYGNIMADIILGKKYLPDSKSSHSWEVGFDLLKAAKTSQQKAFVYGYLCHLASDTVAHNSYTVDTKNLGHTLLEMKADSIIDKKYWFQAMLIDRKTQVRNDLFLENSLDRFLFSFKTNKRIFKGMVFFSFMNQQKIGDFIDRRLVTSMPDRDAIELLHQESLDKMIDLLQNFEGSEVISTKPGGSVRNGKFAKAFVQFQAEKGNRRFFYRQ
jgi:hypothetical protein